MIRLTVLWVVPQIAAAPRLVNADREEFRAKTQ
jgi:hypothetical protein